MTKIYANIIIGSDLKGIAFDLDETLTKSKQPITKDMARLLEQLANKLPVAIVSGATRERIETQVLSFMDTVSYKNLILYPTNGAAMFTYEDSTWKPVYKKIISEEEVLRINEIIINVVKTSSFLEAATIWGPQLEFRGSQITFSALGQEAPYEPKFQWDADKKKRLYLRELIATQLPEYDVLIGGTTSIDVIPKGVNKAYGVIEFAKHIKSAVENIMYVGDDLEKGGNDYVVATDTKARTHSVKNPEDTKLLIEELLKNI